MTEIVSLTTAEVESVYKIELSKVEEVVALRKSGEDASVFRPKISTRIQSYEKELAGIIGEERFQKWQKHEEDERAKK